MIRKYFYFDNGPWNMKTEVLVVLKQNLVAIFGFPQCLPVFDYVYLLSHYLLLDENSCTS